MFFWIELMRQDSTVVLQQNQALNKGAVVYVMVISPLMKPILFVAVSARIINLAQEG